MTAKQKVMKLSPTVICAVVKMYDDDRPDYQIWVGRVYYSKMQPRESWAWAEAYRNLTNPTQNELK